ncbi:MAG: hypothetical protein ACRD27_11735 [Terracidiphilus sp.]
MLVLSAASLEAQMANPDIDKPGEPFSYPACSTDEIALQNAPMGTEITPEGYLYTGYGQLTFSVGNPSQPASQRIRTLEKGYLPIVHYTYSDGPVRYDLTTFAGTLSGQSENSNTVNFIRVTARNTGAAKSISYFSVAFPYTGAAPDLGQCSQGNHRFRRPVTPAKPGGYAQPGVVFDPNWTYAFKGGLATRSGEVVYQFPTIHRPVLRLTENVPGSEAQQTGVSPKTPVLVARYELHLQPGSSQTLVFKMPVQPISADDTTAVKDLESTSFDAAFRQTERVWENRLNGGIQISLPEKEVTDAFKANLIYDMMARDHVGDNYIQTVNKLQYHAFWLRDGSHIMNAYDVAGFPNLVRESLPFFLESQQPDGLFISQNGQYDGWGQALWTFGRYYQFSHDQAFARSIFPAVLRAVHWLEQARENDPLHIMPAGNPHDDEFHVSAHVTGHNLWALAGLKGAIVLAQAAGTKDEVQEFQHDYDDYHQVLFRLLDSTGAKNGDYIPPGIDVAGGQDWGNMNVVYPEMLLPANDPLITGTLQHVRKEYAEGLMTYAGRLHDYIGFKNTETELILEQQPQVIQDLYAVLAHTSSTRAGWEVGPLPWTTRDFGRDLAPHGWFAADYVALLRNMLLREQGGDLHLLSALSPDWTQPGDTIEVSNAPTEFGKMGMECRFSHSGMSMTLQTRFNRPPARIVVHLPWFVTVKSATVDGKVTRIHDGVLSIPASSRKIEVAWTTRSPAPSLSYRSAVKDFLRDYEAHYREYLRDGSPVAKPARID